MPGAVQPFRNHCKLWRPLKRRSIFRPMPKAISRYTLLQADTDRIHWKHSSPNFNHCGDPECSSREDKRSSASSAHQG
jgi:hypothetical protein